ncbi:MAG: hypothetical protein AABY22_21660 [Nanoarchaeota archaeon]
MNAFNYQLKEESSNLILPLHFEKCELKDVSKFIKDNHYSHTYPGGVDYSFRLLYNNQLAGACLFGHMAGNPKALCLIEGYDNPLLYRELMRLVLLDEVPKNSESKFIAWCIRWLKKNTDLIGLISFADPKFGHSGTIYKASNWIYCGLQKGILRPRMIIEGEEMHPRMAFNKFGTSSIYKLREMGLTIEIQPREPKHRYVYILKLELKNLLKKRLFNVN